jgi:hypothetical protein
MVPQQQDWTGQGWLPDFLFKLQGAKGGPWL